MIGGIVSHYRVLERLGAGGMGEVFLAEDLRLRRQVALKMLRTEGCKDGDRARLLREARVASSLNHPNIAVIYEVDEGGEDDDRPSFIAMEHVRGETLAERLRRGRLPLTEVLALSRQIAGALQEAHARGVVHRDVKPSNVMITEGGRVKVLDFGLATFNPSADDADTWSRAPEGLTSAAGSLVGTLSYMSPEQARGRDIDARSDVFSLGIVLHEMLTGRLPFVGATAVEVLDAILHRDPPPPGTGDSLPPGVHRLVTRMLAKDRDRRPQDMNTVCEELGALQRLPEPQAAPTASAAKPTVAVMAFENITHNAEDDWLGTGIAETLSSDLKSVQGLAVMARERIHEVLRTLDPADLGEGLAATLGRALGARFVLSGGYQRVGDSVRATARLTDVETGTVAHTVKVDGRIDRIFELQDRIVAELSAGLRRAVQPAGGDAEETRVLAAYEACVKGTINLRLETHESVDRAIVFFERATNLDPTYARAFLALGQAYETKAAYLVVPEFRERAIVVLRRALELRPDLAGAWRELGACLVGLGREEEGIEAIRRALALDPEEASAHAAMARAFFVGRADFEAAATRYEKALAINPQAGWYALQLAHCSALLRQFERGEQAARRAAVLQEDFLSGRDGIVIVGSYMRLGHLAALQGRYAEAVDHLRRELRFLDTIDHALRGRIRIELHQRLGWALLELGQEAEGQAALEVAIGEHRERVRVGADDPYTRYYVAGAYAARGQLDQALASLEVSLRDLPRFTAARARIEPEFEALRTDRRFLDLLERR